MRAGGTRTPNPLIRSQMLYPVEPQALINISFARFTKLNLSILFKDFSVKSALSFHLLLNLLIFC